MKKCTKKHRKIEQFYSIVFLNTMYYGKPIPAGTGMKRYRNVKLDTDEMLSDEIMLSDEDELVLASEDENEMNLTEDNVAEEVLALDDMADVDEDEEV